MKKRHKNSTALVLLLIGAFSFIIAAAFLVASYFTPEKEEMFDEETGSGTEITEENLPPERPDIIDLSESEPTPETYNRPYEMRGCFVNLGEDIFKKQSTEEELKRELKEFYDSTENFIINTVIFETVNDRFSVIDTEGVSKIADYDALKIMIDSARERGMYVYFTYPLLREEEKGLITPDIITRAERELKALTDSYSPDGILFTDLENGIIPESYGNFLKYGSGKSFEEYMLKSSEKLVSHAAAVVRGAKKGIQAGLLTSAADKSQKDGGYTNIKDENCTDIKRYTDRNILDFIVYDNSGALGSGAHPFDRILKDWLKISEERHIPVYPMHRTQDIGSNVSGWGDTEEITRQIITARGMNAYSGSVFSSMKSLMENDRLSRDMLIGYLTEQITSDYVMAELTMSGPAKFNYETYETVVTFRGATSPQVPVYINGEKIDADRNGYFSITKELTPGNNSFKVVSKDKEYSYDIYRRVKIIDSVSPTGNLNVLGGTNITVSVKAYKDSKIKAALNGETIELEEVYTDTDGEENNSTYVLYEGEFTAPKEKENIQKLGNIMIYGSYRGLSEKASGAYVNVNKKLSVSGGVPVRVTSDAETFPTTTFNNYSSRWCYPLPEGALDYTVGDELIYTSDGVTYKYYNLASGRRIETKNIERVKNGPGKNEIKGMTVENDGRHTIVSLNMTENVSFIPEIGSDRMKIKFNYTQKTCEGIPKLKKSPLFSSAVFNGAELTLKFRKSGIFMGYHAEYDEKDHKLSLIFNNPPGTLSNARITIDPGHGRVDPGALGNIPGKHESYITARVAKYLEEELLSRGAKVARVETDVDHKVSLATREQTAIDLDAQIFISVHCNSALNTEATGHEVFWFYEFQQPLAESVNRGIGKVIPVDRGAKFGYYYVTRTSRYAAVLSELGFVSNRNEYSKLLKESNQREIAEGIADSLERYLNSTYTGEYPKGREYSGNTEYEEDEETSHKEPEESREDSEEESEESDDSLIECRTEEILMYVGETADIEATPPDEYDIFDIIWKSENEKVATVDKIGTVTAVGEGETTVSGTLKGTNSTVRIKVYVLS